jgi:C1A family cysteine protease
VDIREDNWKGILMRSNRRYGWRPELPDYRDYLYSTIQPKISLPKKVDLRTICSKVENQEELGSCTAQAIVGGLEFLECKNRTNFYDISRLFIYYNERVLENSVNEDAGAMIRDGIKTLVRWGYCSEVLCPYITKDFAKKPSIKAYNEAKRHIISSYHKVLNLKEMLKCLAEGYPVVFGIMVYEGFTTEEATKTGIINMPEANESPIGGHAILAVGYNQETQRIIFRNSYGESWGDSGYGTLPYEYINKLANDFWTIRKK